MTSKCKQCGEQLTKTGNYSAKILPAKRIPKKAKKLIEAQDTGESSLLGMTKFHKFLLKRSRPANVLELTCGNCGGTSKTKMLKPSCGRNKADLMENERKRTNDEMSVSSTPNLEGTRKKPRNEKSAGLTLPTSILNDGKSHKSTHSPSQSNRSGGAGNPASNAKRQKELEKLNRMLFNSKKAKKSGSTLQDFLSSI